MLKPNNGELFNPHAGDAIFPGEPGYESIPVGKSDVSDFHGAFGAPIRPVTTPASETKSE